jgi:hypothetical protein
MRRVNPGASPYFLRSMRAASIPTIRAPSKSKASSRGRRMTIALF